MKRDSMEREILAVDSGQCCEAINAPFSTQFFGTKLFLWNNFIGFGESVELSFKLILLDPIEIQYCLYLNMYVDAELLRSRYFFPMISGSTASF